MKIKQARSLEHRGLLKDSRLIFSFPVLSHILKIQADWKLISEVNIYKNKNSFCYF